MAPRRLRHILVAGFLAIAPAGMARRAAAAPFFQGIGDLSDGSFSSSAPAVSSDGFVVVGTGNSASGWEAFRWTQAGGMVGLGDLPGGPFGSNASAVSADGAVVAGTSLVPGQEGFRWTQADGMVGLGFVIGDVMSAAYGVSGDGAVVVGWCDAPGNRQGYRWTQAGGMVPLSGWVSSLARGISSDASVIVGWGSQGSGLEAFRWTQAGGMEGLGDLPGGPFRSGAFAASSDGSVIVGQGNYDPASSTSEAFRWSQAGGMVGLGDLPGGLFYSVALAVSSDGSVVVGYGNSALGFEASRWTLADGMRSLRQVLVNDYGLGSSLTGWGLSQATGVSGDGKVIVGSGTNPGGQQEAWIANLRVATLSSTPGNGATLSFGNVLVGSSATRSLSVTNAGDQYTTLAGTFPAGGGRFAPGSTQGFSLAQGAGTSRDYTYTPLARGTDNLDVTITSDGGISGEDATITLWGRGVAPQQQTVLLNNAGLVRIGTSGSARISVTNVGDGNLSGLGVVSNLRGNVALVPGSPPEFTGGTPVDLADGASQTFTYTYTPTGHGPQQATVRADFLNGSDDGRNLAQILDQIITGTGVGPVFASSVAPGGTIGFGDIILGGAGTRTLQISNESTDGVFVNALTGLTLVSYGFGGPDAAAFSLPLFGPGSVVGEGGVLDVEIQLDGTAPLGPKSATLTFTTNQGAAFGGNGQQFMWDLTGNVIEPSYAIPEPTTLGLLGLALAALARRRWRKLPRQ